MGEVKISVLTGDAVDMKLARDTACWRAPSQNGQSPSRYVQIDGDFCHQGQDTEIAHKFKIVETYWPDHSLESSWRALSDGMISLEEIFLEEI
jgi:hypothetical protein